MNRKFISRKLIRLWTYIKNKFETTTTTLIELLLEGNVVMVNNCFCCQLCAKKYVRKIKKTF